MGGGARRVEGQQLANLLAGGVQAGVGDLQGGWGWNNQSGGGTLEWRQGKGSSVLLKDLAMQGHSYQITADKSLVVQHCNI